MKVQCFVLIFKLGIERLEAIDCEELQMVEGVVLRLLSIHFIDCSPFVWRKQFSCLFIDPNAKVDCTNNENSRYQLSMKRLVATYVFSTF